LLIPLSVVLIKYTNIGRHYDQWSGRAEYVGVATSKNMLGAFCLVSGIFFLWDIVTRWPERKERWTKQILFVNFVFLSMTAYLLYRSRSATSAVCLCLGGAVLIAAHSDLGQRHSTFLKFFIPASFCLYLILGFGFGLNANFAETIGRDPTLTDRTKIWNALLSMDTNPLLGTGYESFWLGSRLDLVFQKAHVHVSEAHNGYLEVYLNLGVIGLLLVIGLLVAAYRNICKRELIAGATLTSLNLAVLTIVLFYNVTEASFKHGVMWLVLLLGAIDLAEDDSDEPVDLAAYDTADNDELTTTFVFQTEAQET
jgi:O-antigen ligase